jgi:hypothetical protein
MEGFVPDPTGEPRVTINLHNVGDEDTELVRATGKLSGYRVDAPHTVIGAHKSVGVVLQCVPSPCRFPFSPVDVKGPVPVSVEERISLNFAHTTAAMTIDLRVSGDINNLSLRVCFRMCAEDPFGESSNRSVTPSVAALPLQSWRSA